MGIGTVGAGPPVDSSGNDIEAPFRTDFLPGVLRFFGKGRQQLAIERRPRGREIELEPQPTTVVGTEVAGQGDFRRFMPASKVLEFPRRSPPTKFAADGRKRIGERPAIDRPVAQDRFDENRQALAETGPALQLHPACQLSLRLQMVDHLLEIRRAGLAQPFVDRNSGGLNEKQARRLRSGILDLSRKDNLLQSSAALHLHIDLVAPLLERAFDLFHPVRKPFVKGRAVSNLQIALVVPAISTVELQVSHEIDLAGGPQLVIHLASRRGKQP